MGKNTHYALVNKFNLVDKSKVKNQKTEEDPGIKPDVHTEELNEKANQSDQVQRSLSEEEKLTAVQAEKPEQKATLPQGTTYSINGTYSSRELSEKLKKIAYLVSDEQNQFEINLSIHEIPRSYETKDELKIHKEKILKELIDMLL